MDDREQFIPWLDDNYPDLSPAARTVLLRYGKRLAEGIARIGLVSRGDLPRLYRRHLCESAAPELIRLLPAGALILDVGSGGGLPGIPVAILRPDTEVTLLESRRSKAGFLESTVLELGLKNASVVAIPLEETAGLPRAAWGIALSRAFAWTPPLVRALGEVLTPEGELIRFGSPKLVREGVEVIPIRGEEPRAVQRWPRSTWEGLPGTK